MPAVKNVGEPCAGEPHARFDGGREETNDSRQCRATPGASRLPDQPPVARRVSEGKSEPDAVRCLKRYLARQLFRLMETTPTVT